MLHYSKVKFFLFNSYQHFFLHLFLDMFTNNKYATHGCKMPKLYSDICCCCFSPFLRYIWILCCVFRFFFLLERNNNKVATSTVIDFWVINTFFLSHFLFIFSFHIRAYWHTSNKINCIPAISMNVILFFDHKIKIELIMYFLW